jgi:hypothetical protein
MPVLQVYVSDEDLATLERAAKRLERSIDDLADSAVSEAASNARRNGDDIE